MGSDICYLTMGFIDDPLANFSKYYEFLTHMHRKCRAALACLTPRLVLEIFMVQSDRFEFLSLSHQSVLTRFNTTP